MFNVGDYRVYFKHFPQETGLVGVPYARDVNSPLEYLGKSQCFVTKNDVEISLGEAYCSVNDNFERSVGRKIAFSRAVSGLERELRTSLWQEFRKMGGV